MARHYKSERQAIEERLKAWREAKPCSHLKQSIIDKVVSDLEVMLENAKSQNDSK